jgi:hypothetical protein
MMLFRRDSKANIMQVVLHFLELVLLYLTLPETKSRSIEDLDDIFRAKSPVKVSTAKKQVIVLASKGVQPVAEI